MISLSDLRQFKQQGRKISCLTCYDASMAKAMELAEIDSILVGDSLGMVIQGHDSTLPVTVADLAYHTAAVRRGNQHAFVMTDLPFLAYATLEQSIENARTVMQAGAQMVKMEGGAWLADVIQVLTRNGVPVCAHLGLTPQSVHVFGGYKVQGKTREAADQLIADCQAVVDAGAAMLLLECVPAQLGKEVAALFPQIPVIGIGAGVDTDGQVLVVQDMLGLNAGHVAKFVRNFMQDQSGATAIQDAFKAFHNEVLAQNFPTQQHSFQGDL